jgi:isopenicillin N synthase-like dioxygenase
MKYESIAGGKFIRQIQWLGNCSTLNYSASPALVPYLQVNVRTTPEMGSYSPPTIPVVDVAAIFTRPTNSEDYLDTARRLGEACSVNGGIGITNHGIDPDFIQKAFEINKKYFALSHSEKMKAPHPDGLYPHRGYSGPGKEALASSVAVKTVDKALREELGSTLDHKVFVASRKCRAGKLMVDQETYEIGNEANAVNYNIWLPEESLPGFRAFTTELYWRLTKFTRIIIDALALGAGFTEKERKYAVDMHTGLDSAIRLLHYPASRVGSLDGSGGRLGAHTDWG